MDGYRKHKGSLFKIALPNVWNVIVCSPDLLDDFRRAPENEMSIFFGIGEVRGLFTNVDARIDVSIKGIRKRNGERT